MLFKNLKNIYSEQNESSFMKAFFFSPQGWLGWTLFFFEKTTIFAHFWVFQFINIFVSKTDKNKISAYAI